jgi:phosphoribosylformimino-5-aminoimidazole carboxamide ribotide isomerase
MIIIPAIDIIDGKCVRLTKGDYSKMKIYHEDPLEMARIFEDKGFNFLHLVDLDGARMKRIVNHRVLERIATGTGLTIDFGGGVQSDADIRLAFNAGATQVTGGSVAVRNPGMFERWIAEYGPEKIILGADVKGDAIAVSGWQETSQTKWTDFINMYSHKGIKYVISTDISKDGVLEGPSVELYGEMKRAHPELNLIASGGVASLNDIRSLQPLSLYGVIVGKALYEGMIDLDELKKLDR